MQKQKPSGDRTAPVADMARLENSLVKHLRPFASELRLLEPVDYVRYCSQERFASIADLVDTAGEMYFCPGTIELVDFDRQSLPWNGGFEVCLPLKIKLLTGTLFIHLAIGDSEFSLKVRSVSTMAKDRVVVSDDIVRELSILRVSQVRCG